ncbi:6-N-hydroxylaminopurine resistance protein [Salmonella enterica subsp. enterica]|uniref:6-N-hydroxylaminopurine resistance protein n=1 Tax=Salmonella enterica I TaxID=59201 RepID=A0A447TQS5_SALET|nr:6-N-hydroxylaminopurine resistance protein [Salmonella enterica subsp. enterica]
MTRFFLYPRKEQQMHYPVDVFIGKIRDYDGSRPSAIAKVQIDGELMLTELGPGRRSAGRKENPRRPRPRAMPLPPRTLC